MSGYDGVSRRRFVRSTAAGLGAGTLAGCSALDFQDDGLDAPDYDQAAVEALFQEELPTAPATFPIDVPRTRIHAHNARIRSLIESVPESPDIPNEAISTQIAEDREHLIARLEETPGEQRRLQRLHQSRSHRGDAAELWGAYVAATDQYDATEFRERYHRLRAQYAGFEADWEYRGSDPVTALVVHRTIEYLFTRGKDALLSTGPFPTDPQTAVFEAARMIEHHEDAAARIGDAEALLAEQLAGQPDAPPNRLRFMETSKRLFRSTIFERHAEGYDKALDEGRSILGRSLERGPDAVAFQSARRYTLHGDRHVREAWDEHTAADAVFRAARRHLTRPVFRETVDAIRAAEITWPEDVSALRALRAETMQSMERAWSTDPQPLAVELAATALDVLDFLDPQWLGDDVDDHDIARYVGRLHHAKRLADRVPTVTQRVVDTLDDV